MRIQSISIIAGAFALLAMSNSTRAASPDACTLLTNADAAKALEVPTVTTSYMVPGSTAGCFWSNDPKASDTSRKVGLNTHTPRAYQFAKQPAITTIKVEAVPGVGDDAIYQIYPQGHPFIWVLKGQTAISIRILTIDKPRPFTDAQEKAKLLVLAKAAVAKL